MMAKPTSVLFCAAAGPRIGYGHLVRTTTLASAVGADATLSLRGGATAHGVARDLGWTVTTGGITRQLARIRPTVVVIDEPVLRHAAAWRRAAGRYGIPVVSVHDLGLSLCDADLTVDASIVRPHGEPRGPALLGPRYQILRPHSRRRRDSACPVVLIALGGGPRLGQSLAIARAIRADRPDVHVRVAGGFSATSRPTGSHGVTWVPAGTPLASELAAATVVVAGGGVTLYEACCLGTPAVGVAVVAAQHPTIDGLSAAGAVEHGGRLSDPRRIARRVLVLLDDSSRRARMSRSGRQLVDGRGAIRVATHVRRLARQHGPLLPREART